MYGGERGEQQRKKGGIAATDRARVAAGARAPKKVEAFAGGLDAPQFSATDLNRDGAMDLYVFDRVGNVSIPMIYDGPDGVVNYSIDWSAIDGFNLISASMSSCASVAVVDVNLISTSRLVYWKGAKGGGGEGGGGELGASGNS